MSGRSVCIVTGATGGIGRAVVATLKRDGWCVSATGHGDEGALQDTLGADDVFVSHDLGKADAPSQIVAATLDRFGQIDGLVHCAGTSHVASFPNKDDEDWERVIDINLSAAHRVARAAARAMISGGRGGAIVMISSIAWMSGGANPAYGAAKGGINTMTYNMAQALGPHGVRANAIAPGIIATAMVRGTFPGDDFERLERAASARTPLRRLGKPEDVAAVAAFLLSEGAGFVTGAVIPVTGGLELLPPIGQFSGGEK